MAKRKRPPLLDLSSICSWQSKEEAAAPAPQLRQGSPRRNSCPLQPIAASPAAPERLIKRARRPGLVVRCWRTVDHVISAFLTTPSLAPLRSGAKACPTLACRWRMRASRWRCATTARPWFRRGRAARAQRRRKRFRRCRRRWAAAACTRRRARRHAAAQTASTQPDDRRSALTPSSPLPRRLKQPMRRSRQPP